MSGPHFAEAALRLGLFLGVFVLLGLAEILAPRRTNENGRKLRWSTNLGLLAVDGLAQRLTVGAVVISAALYAEAEGFGLLRLGDTPPILAAVLGFVALDFAVWLQHVASHRWPLLWRLHQVHHADLEVDVTTGVRFHPGEILLSAAFKASVVLALGIGPWTALVFEAVLNASSLFTHSNLSLPSRLDRGLRRVVCTPDMHRIHHSIRREEADSNYGFFLSVWDRLFGVMRAAPAEDHRTMPLGLPGQRERLTLPALLLLPFRRTPARDAAVNSPRTPRA